MPGLEYDKLRAIRARSLLFTKYIFWTLSFAFVLLIANGKVHVLGPVMVSPMVVTG